MPGMRLLELESVLFDGKGSVCCGGCGDVGGEKLRDLLQGEVCGKESTIVYGVGDLRVSDGGMLPDGGSSDSAFWKVMCDMYVCWAAECTEYRQEQDCSVRDSFICILMP